MSDLTCTGKTFRMTVHDGVAFHNSGAPGEATLHHETAAGRTNGAVADVDLPAAEISRGAFLPSRPDRPGTTIAHAVNPDSKTDRARSSPLRAVLTWLPQHTDTIADAGGEHR
ncbi:MULTISPECIES: hypothetical protein [Streptomyces]|uniref:hypothetical protein n=1 Tax=Streptomyces TaxID=1883 RepID=UPI002E288003|nr:hypothetical protein [Streptomyces sp. NBC_00271]